MSDLDEAYQSALDKGKFSNGPILVGELQDFDPDEVRTSPLKFIVRDQKLWVTSTNSVIHSEACHELAERIKVPISSYSPSPASFASGKDVYFEAVPSLYGSLAKTG